MNAAAQTTTEPLDEARPSRPWTLADAEQSCAEPFERHAARHPERFAVLSEGSRLTYGELNARANRLAHALIARGARGDRVALVLGHNASMIAGLLAVWKAGMVAVPLEITHPVERLANIVADADCSMIVSEPAHRSIAAALGRPGAHVLVIDDEANGQPSTNPRLEIAPGELSGLVYTSGSTGRPKGVMQTHRQAMRNVIGYSNKIAIVPNDRLVLLASCAAAQGLATVTCALANGASLFPFSVRDAGVVQLAQFIRQQAITLFISAATVFRHLVLTLGENEVLDSVRMVRLGSEPIHGSDVAAFRRHFRADCMMLTALSCTETANITLHHVDPTHDADMHSVPVGWPVPGMEVLLLDEAGNDVGVDREGEIVVRSRYLSPGYWRDEQRTAAVFVEGADGSDLRRYHTGDLGRRRADGCLIHTGRRDFRVKVRGFGVELEEVETVLRQHPRVKTAVASLRQDKLGDHYLVAHLVTPPGEPPTLEEVQQHVLARLAAHMMPAEFLVVDRLPLTSNGKVDRRAVATLDGKVLRNSSASVPPRTALERQLIRTWEDVLSFRPIGAEDDFFAIGGNSLLAGLVISRVAAAFDVELPLRMFLGRPTVAALARTIRQTRLAARLRPASAITPVPRGAPIIASFAQQRLWLLDQIEPGSNAYNLPRAIQLTGPLDLAALERALREIVRRHETLRTTFATTNDQPVQVIAEHGPFVLEVIEGAAAGGDRDTRESSMRELLAAEALRPFDLRRGPLFRAALFRLGADEHVLLLNIHHIVSDLWSYAVLLRELSHLYTAFSQGQPSSLPELAVQYADFTVWQRHRLQGEFLKRQRDYWAATLAGLPALDLPTDRPRPREQATASALEPVEIPPELTSALGALARDNQSTLYMTLLAVFQTLLHRYTGQEDFAVGGVIAGRNRVDVEQLIGFFVNTLVHRADVSGQPTFLELLARVRDSALGAFEHQDLPFERLVEELNPPRDPNRTPFFQVAFLLQNTPRTKLTMPGLTVTNLETGRGAAKFDLTFSLHEEDGRLRGGVEFNPALFDRATVQRLIGHYCTLGAGAVREPSCRVAELPMLTTAERTELLIDFNRPAQAQADCPPAFDGAMTLTEAFAEPVRRRPEATALVLGAHEISYAALNARANQLARHLQARGVQTGDRIALFLDRSVELVVSILATLKAGAIYVPLDLHLPAGRLQFIIADTAARVLITHGASPSEIAGDGITTLDLARESDAIARCAPTDPEARRTASDPACIMYTSGSTGRPKGVVIPHRGIVRLVRGQTYAPFTPEQRFLLLASPAFDASTFELWGALLSGATCVIFPERWPDFELLEREIRAHGVTCLWLTAGLFNQIIDQRPGVLATVRHVVTGGEALSVPHVHRALARLPHLQLVNGYGPTECTTFASTYLIPKDGRWLGASVPIGRPIGRTEARILDPHGQPVPIGVPGELHLGGDGLASGYWRRPDLTAEKFVSDCLAANPDTHLYRTGDRCRWHADGTIEFLGRLDHQVKIRGFRVELGEIETVLRQHPAAVDAVVTTGFDRQGERCLIGYVTLRPEHGPSNLELRAHLQGKLPEYMVPTTVVVLDHLPLTPNGKVDRTALPMPEALEADTARAWVAPRTATEEMIAAIWQEILQLKKVSVHDNFFDLGGHSLLAMQVQSRIRRTFGGNLPLRLMFENPTVAGLAAVIHGLAALHSPKPAGQVGLEESII